MQQFLRDVFVFSFILIITFLSLLSLADGSTDPFYLRFTTPKQQNLIIGTSRAAQGLQPYVINKVLGRPFYNYAFTITHSPYGETYFNSIKKKLKVGRSRGLFIVVIDPWSISSKTIDPNDSASFAEKKLCVGNTPWVSLNPNFIYLINNLKGSYYTTLFKGTTSLFLHNDGWLEVSTEMDSVAWSMRFNSLINNYKENNLPYFKFSNVRFRYLRNTIRYLSGFGDVYLVRLPIHPMMMQIENRLMPDFTDKIKSLEPLTMGYFDMTTLNDQFSYTDAHHLYKPSGARASQMVAEWIKSIESSQTGEAKRSRVPR